MTGTSEARRFLSQEMIDGIINDYEEKLRKDVIGNEIYRLILESFGYATFNDEGERLSGKVILTSEDYPDYYGGAFIDSQGNFIANIVGIVKKSRRPLMKLSVMKTSINIPSAKFAILTRNF